MLASVVACALAVQLVQSPPPPPAAAGPQVLTGAVSTPTIRAPRPAALTSMYVSLAALQGLDVHSTMRALSSGAREANPAMRGIVGNPAGLIAVKAATAAGTIVMTEQMRKNHPRAALIFMTAVNTAMAVIVARNYSLGEP